MAVAIDPKTGKPLNVPMPQQSAQQKDFLGRPMKPFTNTPLTGNDATALERTPMPDYMQTMYSDAVKANGGNPLPSGSNIVNSWANLAPTNTPNMPQQAQQSGFSIDKSSLQAEAAARIAKLRAGVQGAVTAGKASRKNLYDYTNTNTQGNRALQDFDSSQRGDIYGGSAREDKFRLQRTRGIDDTFTNNAYTNDINALDNQLTSFDTLAPEQQQTLYNDLLRQERDYGLQEGALTGYLNGQKTASQANSDRTFDYNAGQDTITNNRNAATDTFNQSLDTAKYGLDVQKQHIDLANKLTELFGVKVNPTSNPMESYAQVAGLSTTAAQKIAADAKQSTFDNAIKSALANNTITQTQATMMNQARMADISQQNANTSSRSATNSANNTAADNTRSDNTAEQTRLNNIWKNTGKAPAGITGVAEGTLIYDKGATNAGLPKDSEVNSFISKITSLYVTKIPYSDGKTTISNPDGMKKAVIEKFYREDGQNDDLIDSILEKFGLPTN